MREVDRCARDRQVPPPKRARDRRDDLGGRAGRPRARNAPATGLPRADRLDGVPEPRLGAESVAEGGHAGRRGVHRARRSRQGGARAGERGARDRADRRPVERADPLSAPALRRHAAARRDRHGARQEPGVADPRRAHHRARRDGRGRGARPRQPAPVRARHRGALHQPQPRRHLEDVLDGRRALRRAPRRGGPCRDGPPGPAPSVHGRPAALHPARRSSQGPRPPRHHSRASSRLSARSFPAASSPIAARWPTSAATPRSLRSSSSPRGTRAGAGTTTGHGSFRARRPPTSSYRASTARSRRSSSWTS